MIRSFEEKTAIQPESPEGKILMNVQSLYSIRHTASGNRSKFFKKLRYRRRKKSLIRRAKQHAADGKPDAQRRQQRSGSNE